MMDIPVPPGNQNNFGVEFAAAKIDQIRVSTGQTGLCFRCRHGLFTRRASEQDARVMCSQIGQRMPPDIAVCSRFQAAGQLTIFELINLCDPMDVLSKQRAGFKVEP